MRYYDVDKKVIIQLICLGFCENKKKTAQIQKTISLEIMYIILRFRNLSLLLICTKTILQNSYVIHICGNICLQIKKDFETKKSRGFAFIRFVTEESQNKALNEEHEIAGKQLTVMMSKKKVCENHLQREFSRNFPENVKIIST